MIFSAVKTPVGLRDYAPWCVFVDGQEIINGIENEAEALSIIQLLRTAKPKPVPAPKPRFVPRQIEGCKLVGYPPADSRATERARPGAFGVRVVPAVHPGLALWLAGFAALSHGERRRAQPRGFGRAVHHEAVVRECRAVRPGRGGRFVPQRFATDRHAERERRHGCVFLSAGQFRFSASEFERNGDCCALSEVLYFMVKTETRHATGTSDRGENLTLAIATIRDERQSLTGAGALRGGKWSE